MNEKVYVDFNYIPTYHSLGFRVFKPGQRHITRVSEINILLIVTKGVLRFEEDGEEREVCAGEYYIQRIGLLQSGNRESDMPEYYYINFNCKYTKSPDRALPLEGIYGEKLLSYCRNLYLAQQSSDLDTTPLMMIKKQTIFYDILNHLYKRNYTFAEKYKLSEEIAKYLVEHFKENITLERLSKEFSYSCDHIIRIFKSRYNMTPMKYLSEYRINYAKMLLITGEDTISKIAAECGFNDITAFYYAFVKSTGVSPREYRLINSEDDE